MRVFFDASALVKRYVAEDGTELLNELFRQFPRTQMICTMFGILEIISVLARKRNDGRLPEQLFAQALIELNREILDDDDFAIASVDDDLTLSALPLIVRYNINATDAIVLRSCLNLHALLTEQNDRLIFWSCDKRLLRAAQAENTEVFDPEVETLSRLLTLHSIS